MDCSCNLTIAVTFTWSVEICFLDCSKACWNEFICTFSDVSLCSISSKTCQRYGDGILSTRSTWAISRSSNCLSLACKSASVVSFVAGDKFTCLLIATASVGHLANMMACFVEVWYCLCVSSNFCRTVSNCCSRCWTWDDSLRTCNGRGISCPAAASACCVSGGFCNNFGDIVETCSTVRLCCIMA